MIEKREALIGTTHKRVATIYPVSDTDETMSFTLVSADNGGMRYDWMSGESYEEFLSVSGANTERLSTLFKDHDRSVDSAVGRISNVRVDDNELIGDVVFGSDSASQAIYEKYRSGILTDVSVGYEINTYTVEEREGNPDLVTVTDYNIFEVSAVGVGFDSGASKREKEGDILMADKKIETPAVETRDLDVELGEAKDAEVRAKEETRVALAEVAELKRQKEITDISVESDVEAELTERFISDDTKTPAMFMREVLKAKAKKTEVAVLGVPDEANMKRELSDAVVVKLGGKVDLKDNTFRAATMLDLGRKLTGYNGYDRVELAKRMMVTTDFPVLLVESGNRVLEQEWERQALTYKQFVKEVDLQDFKQVKDVTRGGAGGRLDKITEGGELSEKYLSEEAEAWNLESFGNKFILTREMLINDDLGAFTNMLGEFVEMAGSTANGRVYDLLRKQGDYASYLMGDGVPIFDAGHGGNALTLALAPDALRTGRVVMRRQIGMDGSTPLNINPSYLLVPPELEQTALEMLNSTATLTAEQNSGVVNTEYKMLTPIVDAEMTSATEWYMLANRRTIKVGYLAGTGRRPILQTNTSSLTQTVFEGIFDFGVMAEDYRGLVQGNV